MSERGEATRVIGFTTAVALVMGNMIGSGVFLLPASLAPYGGLSVIGWLISSAGAVLLALVFARLARHAPAPGGPYAYTRMAFGDLAGFLIAWVYWLSVWCGNAAIAVAFGAYASTFLPEALRTTVIQAALAIVALWTLVTVNVLGVREAGRVQVATTILKVIPLVVLGVAGLFVLDASHFPITQTTATGVGRDLFATITLTVWAFTGFDSATIPAGHVRDPDRTIPRATVIGTVLTACIYIVGTVAVMGIVPPATLATSTAPFADAARALFGDVAALIVAGGAAISAFGALNGWTLMAGQLPQAAARDGLFPAALGATSRRGTPATATIIAGVLGTALIAANYTRGLVGLFTFIILLATLGALVPYAFAALAGFLIGKERVSRKQAVVGWLAFAYAFAAIAGSGFETVFWGFLLLLAGLPLYVWVVLGRRRNGAEGAGAVAGDQFSLPIREAVKG
jgi:APA family basic amino acid/polyamine antiporter